MSDRIDFIRPDWPAPDAVGAAFTLRRGGVSQPPFDSLNVAAHTGDDPRAVAENRRRVRASLQLPAEPTWLAQVHGAAVVRLDGHTADGHGADGYATGEGGAPPTADASITRRPGQVCAVQVADCMPVLLAARDGSAVGAAHAGWRGLAAGVLGAIVHALGEEPFLIAPDRLIAWMGPAIGPGHFEVGEEVRAAFLAADGGAGAAFTSNARGRWQCDLYALARRRLAAAGVRDVYGGGWCTHADPGRFYSYRRDGQCGRMAALIWIAHDQ
ncbi:MAG: peptidoglycan editing factor PgeF [Steroidobacteraceae bacterium]